MDEWVTTKEASATKKVGLSQHRIAELARNRDIVADKTGTKKWLVKVTFNNGKYKLVKAMAPAEIEQAQVVTKQLSKETGQDTRLREHFDQLATIAKVLAFREQWLLDYEEAAVIGNIVEGLRATSLSARSYDKELFLSVDLLLAGLLLKHFNHQFPDLALEGWDNIAIEGAQEVSH